jgi:hypothetical protein
MELQDSLELVEIVEERMLEARRFAARKPRWERKERNSSASLQTSSSAGGVNSLGMFGQKTMGGCGGSRGFDVDGGRGAGRGFSNPGRETSNVGLGHARLTLGLFGECLGD